MSPVFLLALLALIGLAIFLVSNTRSKNNQQMKAMGFTPSSPTPALTAKVSELYRMPTTPYSRYELRRVYQRVLPSGELYIFDLFEVSGDPSWLSKQMVAVLSSRLNLPHFVLNPKSDMGNWISGLADKAIVWAGSSYGESVQFVEHPEFERRYTLNSTEPEKVRQFFSPDLIERLSQTRLYSIHAKNDLFTFTELNPQATGRLDLQLRMERATEVLEWFQARTNTAQSG